MTDHVTKQEFQELADRVTAIEENYVHKGELEDLRTILSEHTSTLSRIEQTLSDQGDRLDQLEAKWQERFASVERDLYSLQEQSKSIESKLDILLERIGE